MSQPTMAITSCSSLSTAIPHKHASSTLFSTYPLQTGRDCEQGELGNPSSATPGSMTMKNLGVGSALPGTAPPGMVGPGLCTIKSMHGPPVGSMTCLPKRYRRPVARQRWPSPSERGHPIEGQRRSLPAPVSSMPPAPVSLVSPTVGGP
jgi:hypothetical protein